ncbi:MAG: hypothetical protein WBE26_02710 [Phycisphaerae bacterium]
MREPSREEMIEGIHKAMADELERMRYGYFDLRPPQLLATTLDRAMKTVIREWLDTNSNTLIAFIKNQAEEQQEINK